MTHTGERLEDVFGKESQGGFGSAVFRRPHSCDSDLETQAREIYRAFVGEAWTRFGPEAWLAPWAKLAARSDPAEASVLSLLETLSDPVAVSSADMLVNAGADPQVARDALVTAFDQPGATDLQVFRIGDGAAMSGLLLASCDRQLSEATFLVFLMD